MFCGVGPQCQWPWGGLNGCGRMGARVQGATGRPLAGRAPDPAPQVAGQGSRRPRRPEWPEPGRRRRGGWPRRGPAARLGAAEPRQHDRRKVGACRGRVWRPETTHRAERGEQGRHGAGRSDQRRRWPGRRRVRAHGQCAASTYRAWPGKNMQGRGKAGAR